MPDIKSREHAGTSHTLSPERCQPRFEWKAKQKTDVPNHITDERSKESAFSFALCSRRREKLMLQVSALYFVHCTSLYIFVAVQQPVLHEESPRIMNRFALCLFLNHEVQDLSILSFEGTVTLHHVGCDSSHTLATNFCLLVSFSIFSFFSGQGSRQLKRQERACRHCMQISHLPLCQFFLNFIHNHRTENAFARKAISQMNIPPRKDLKDLICTTTTRHSQDVCR